MPEARALYPSFFLERTRAFFLYGNAHVGGLAVGFMLGTYALYGLPPDGPLLVLAFCGVFGVYQFERALFIPEEDRYNQPERVAWVRGHRGYVLTATGLATLAGTAMLPLLRPATVHLGAALGVLGILYRSPLLPGRRRLKAAGPAKPWILGGAWAFGGVVVPLVEAGAPLTPVAFALVGYRLLFLLPNTLLADWPDREGDTRAGLQTVAATLSPERLHRLAALSAVLAALGGLAACSLFGATRLLYIDLVGPLLMGAAVWRPRTPSRWYHGFLLDLLVAWPAVTALVAGLGFGG